MSVAKMPYEDFTKIIEIYLTYTNVPERKIYINSISGTMFSVWKMHKNSVLWVGFKTKVEKLSHKPNSFSWLPNQTKIMTVGLYLTIVLKEVTCSRYHCRLWVNTLWGHFSKQCTSVLSTDCKLVKGKDQTWYNTSDKYLVLLDNNVSWLVDDAGIPSLLWINV